MEEIFGIRIDIDGALTFLPPYASYSDICEAVDGWPADIPTDGSIDIWFNEESQLLGRPRNHLVNFLWACVDSGGWIDVGSWVAGPCVVAGPVDDAGRPTSLPAWFYDVLTVGILLDANRRP